MRLLLILGLLFAHAAHAQVPAFSSADLMRNPHDGWLTNGGNLSNHRYSPLTQIDTTNVGQLRAAWRVHLDGSGLGPQYSGRLSRSSTTVSSTSSPARTTCSPSA
jgi:alcohol dehydrogenase (cytochrome c)